VATVLYRGVAVDRADAAKLPKLRPRVTMPLRTEKSFWRDLDGDFQAGAGEVKESLNLMVASTLEVEGGAGGASKGDAEGRAVLIGDGDFMTNKLAGNNGNVLVFVDSLAWLIGNEELSGEVASEEDIPIEHSREQDKVWFYGTIFAVPAPVLLAGLWIARRRRRRSEAKA
jgi:hypothetical protein